MRQYQTLITALIILLIFTTIAVTQFGQFVVDDFLQILPSLSSNVHPSVNNQSWTSLLHRSVLYFTEFDLSEELMLIHKIGLILLSGILFIIGTKLYPGTKQARAWLFGAFVMVMMISSPLVWYHHSVFLLIPILISVKYKNYFWGFLMLVIILLIQVDRLFEFVKLRYAAPVLVAHLILIVALIATYFQNYKQIFRKQYIES
jgi:hypothetical protein